VGDRAVVPFTLLRGVLLLSEGLFVCCDQTNPNAEMAKAAMGQSLPGLFGFSHMMGGYAGGQAEYLHVPFADVAPIKIPDGIRDEKVLFLSDIFPTGYMAAENCAIEPGHKVERTGA
jgi:threonine dehydrogenase-like Zn-dependent dehydrogenase